MKFLERWFDKHYILFTILASILIASILPGIIGIPMIIGLIYIAYKKKKAG